jgi:hypothetical protein
LDIGGQILNFGRGGRLAGHLAEIDAAKVENLHLPMPTDARLRTMADQMMAAPADRGTL